MKHSLRISLLTAMAACLLPASSVVPTTDISVGAVTTVSSGGFLQMAVITQPNGTQGIKFFGDFDPFCGTSSCTFYFSATFTNKLGPDLNFSFDFDILNNTSDVNLTVVSSVDGVIFSDVDAPNSPSWQGGFTVSNGTISFEAVSSSNFQIHIPNNSLDFTPTASAVPEPGSLTLIAGAAGLLLFRARSVRK